MWSALAVSRSARAGGRRTVRLRTILGVAEDLIRDDVAVIVDMGVRRKRIGEGRASFVAVIPGRVDEKDGADARDFVIGSAVETVIPAEKFVVTEPCNSVGGTTVKRL